MKRCKWLLPIALVTLLMGCNQRNKKDDSSDDPAPAIGWSEEVKSEMQKYLGEILPYAPLNEETLYHTYDDSYEDYGFGVYIIGDDNEVNVLEEINYSSLLIEAGFSEETEDDTIYYTKDIGDDTLEVVFQYFEETDEYAAGNEIDVYCPVYSEPTSEQDLIDDGYTKQLGWPTELVANTLNGCDITITGVNTSGYWFVATEKYEDTDEGYYYECLYLATEGDYVDEFVSALPSVLVYDEDWDDYYDEVSEVDVEVSFDGTFTFINIYGPTLDLEIEINDDISGEENVDGKIVVTYSLASLSGYTDNTSFDGVTLTSENTSLSFSKGSGQSNPAFYSANGVRFYFGNSISINSTGSYNIEKVEFNSITRNSGKAVTTAFLEASVGTLNVTDSSASINDVNAKQTTLSITKKPSGVTSTGGYLVFDEIVITLA